MTEKRAITNVFEVNNYNGYIKLHTTGKEQIVREINRLYSENKDKVCVYFDNAKCVAVSVLLVIEDLFL